MKTRISLLVLVPITIAFILNFIVLYKFATPGLAVVNAFVYVVIVTFTLLFLESYTEKLHKNLKEISLQVETTHYSAKLLQGQASREYIYIQLKQLLSLSLQQTETPGPEKKGYVLMAKELSKICTVIRDADTQLNNHQFFVSDCILKNAEKMQAQLAELHIQKKKKPKKLKKRKGIPEETPLEGGALRKAIRIAEKRTA